MVTECMKQALHVESLKIVNLKDRTNNYLFTSTFNN